MKKNESMVIALLSIAVFLLLFLLSGRFWTRLDLTRNKAYTISEVSRNLHREIPDQVTITYFVSERLKQAHPLPGEIIDLLREYAAYSRGKIRFVQKDPAKEEVMKVVEELGIIPQQIRLAEKNETTVATIYSGILIEYLDREDVIPVVFSLQTLEYDISSRIRSLVRNTEREIGIIVGDAHKQLQSEYGLLYQELYFSGFKIRQINPGDEIPSTLPALMVLGGAEDLDEYCQYLIDRYIAGGGSVLFALDGVFVDTRGSLEARAVQDKGLLAMLTYYGVVIRPVLVLDRTALNLTFQTQSGNTTYIQSVRYPQWIGVQPQSGNPDNPLSLGFTGVDLYWASPIELYPPPGSSAEALFYSTDQAWLQTDRFITNPNYINQFDMEAEETMGRKILGASLSGVFQSAYEDRPKPRREVSEESSFLEDGTYPEDPPDLPVLKKPARIVIVGDADFAGSMMRINQGDGRNLSFLIRAADWLSNDDDMAAIRGRESAEGRLDRITDRDKRDAVMTFSRTLNTIAIPLGVVLAALILVLRRRAYTTKGRTGDV
jgi:ABC-type uncharacterized transport system involved in gliding motility auxiliary subunit